MLRYRVDADVQRIGDLLIARTLGQGSAAPPARAPSARHFLLLSGLRSKVMLRLLAKLK
jgi:hypothetical protein